MNSVLDSVNSRTQLVGENRLELLLFKLDGSQVFGINVFKVKEVLQCPRLHDMPNCHPVVRGVAHIRGGTLPIIDMNQAVGGAPLEDIENCFIIIAEYNRTTQGFLVRTVEHIVNLHWETVHPPPAGVGSNNYLTAVAKIDEKLIEIIDVEKILSEVSPVNLAVDASYIDELAVQQLGNRYVLIVDDSIIARKQVQQVVEAMGIATVTLHDGQAAYQYLLDMIRDGKNPQDELLLILSDIEMPEMDGYTLTAMVKEHPQLATIHLVLHTSLSGVFNDAMVKKVGANDFIAKFEPDDIAKCVSERVQYVIEHS